MVAPASVWFRSHCLSIRFKMPSIGNIPPQPHPSEIVHFNSKIGNVAARLKRLQRARKPAPSPPPSPHLAAAGVTTCARPSPAIENRPLSAEPSVCGSVPTSGFLPLPLLLLLFPNTLLRVRVFISNPPHPTPTPTPTLHCPILWLFIGV